MHQMPNFICLFWVNIWLEKSIYFMLCIMISSVTLVACDTGLVANSQRTALTDSMQPNAPPARWHLWASAALPTSQYTADCKCYHSCQVESIFVSDIGSQCSTNSIMTKKTKQKWAVVLTRDLTNSGQLVSWSLLLWLQSPPLFLHQTARLRPFPYGTSPPGVWYAGV